MLEVLGGDGTGVVEGGGGQGVVGDAIDESGQRARALEHGLDGGRLEQGEFAAGEAQAVGEVVVEFVAVESAEVVAHDESRGERFVHGHAEAPTQFGEPDEQHAQAILGIHFVVAQLRRYRRNCAYADRRVMPRGASARACDTVFPGLNRG